MGCSLCCAGPWPAATEEHGGAGGGGGLPGGHSNSAAGGKAGGSVRKAPRVREGYGGIRCRLKEGEALTPAATGTGLGDTRLREVRHSDGAPRVVKFTGT